MLILVLIMVPKVYFGEMKGPCCHQASEDGRYREWLNCMTADVAFRPAMLGKQKQIAASCSYGSVRWSIGYR